MASNFKELAKYLRRRKITSPETAESQLRSWNDHKLKEFVLTAYDYSHINVELDEPTLFTFSANSSLSGGPMPCSGLSCRQEKLARLTKFSSLYADFVYIENPLEPHKIAAELERPFDRRELKNDLICLLEILPLLQRGYAGFRHNLLYLCEEHYKEIEHFRTETANQLSEMQDVLERMYIDQIEFSLSNFYGSIMVTAAGPEYLIEHGTTNILFSKSEVLPLPEEGETKILSKDEIIDYRVFEMLMEGTIQDLLHQNIHVHMKGSNYLGHREVDLDLIKALEHNSKNHFENHALEAVSHPLPFIEHMDLDYVLDIREKESTAFQVYRDELHKTLKSAGVADQEDLKRHVQETIRPALNEIKNKLYVAHSQTKSEMNRSFLVAIGYLSIGVFAGLLSPSAASVLETLGGLAFFGKMADKIGALYSQPAGVKENPYYFLWKLSVES